MSLAENLDQAFEENFKEANTSIVRDLSLNFKKIMTDSPLSEEERLLALASIASTLHLDGIMQFCTAELNALGVSDERITEAFESAAIMGMLNTYYKFKGFLDAETLQNYSRTGLRMQSLMKPVNGKEIFEMMSFAVSVVNGCPTCVASHEKALVQIGTDREKIHELARLAAVMKGLSHASKYTNSPAKNLS